MSCRLNMVTVPSSYPTVPLSNGRNIPILGLGENKPIPDIRMQHVFLITAWQYVYASRFLLVTPKLVTYNVTQYINILAVLNHFVNTVIFK